MNYFRYIGSRKALSADEEAAAAESIWKLEHSLWEVILENRAMTKRLSERLGDGVDFKTRHEQDVLLDAKERISRFLQETVSSKGRKLGDAKRRELRDTLVEDLYALDEDRTLVASALSSVRPSKEDSEDKKHRAYQRKVDTAARRVKVTKNNFIQENLGLVVNIAKRYHVEKMPLADLIQEGNIGLIRAVDKFDYAKGFRFSTYASWWIRSYISRAIVRKSNTVRIPEYMLRDRNRIKRTEEASRVKNGSAPDEDALATELGLSKKRLMRTRKHDVAFVESLDREMPGSDNQRYIDFLSDEDAKGPLENVEFAAWVRDIPKNLGKLSVTERFVICWRFGLLDGEEMTLQEIGKCLNLSRERIRQIQEEALVKLRIRLEVDAA
jgi:RNA polymerase primary sigma factor